MISSNDSKEQRPGNWFLFILLLTAVLCLPLAIQTSKWVPEANRLIYVAIWASLAGVALAGAPLPDWSAWPIGVILGAEYSLQFAGKLLPKLDVFLGDLGRIFTWLWELIARRSLSPDLPFSRSVSYVAEQWKPMIKSLITWYGAVQKGESSRENTALWLGVSFAIWLLAWHAGFELFRRRRTFVALLPLGVAIISNVCFTDIGMAYVHVYLGVTLLTLVWANTGRMEAIWARLGLDFSPDLRRDSLIAGTFLAAIAFVIAVFIPYKTYNNAVFFFWDHLGTKFQTFYKQLDRAFAGRNPVPKPTPGRSQGLGPHDVRTSGELGQKAVLLVVTSDPVPLPEEEYVKGMLSLEEIIPHHYWRERAYDIYTGHGWDSSKRDTKPIARNQSWSEPSYPYTVLTQTFTMLMGNAELAYAVNEPSLVNRDTRVLTRPNDDVAAFSVVTTTYTVASRIPDVTVEELQAAEDPYPDWVKERYLQLPTIPARVRQTAQDVVQKAGATTRYDKAKAIETYIRSFAYDLELEPPPLDADVVDYFLFTAKRGYCDYSATAMVVMLRAVGVAARYASGYNMGYYDHGQNAWVVSENNAHAWVEVYFPDHGWIEFEPTPTQAPFIHPATRSTPTQPLNSQADQKQRLSVPPLWLGTGALILVLLFVIIWPPRWLRARRSPQQTVLQVYDRLVRRARWLGLSPYGGQTPREYLNALAVAVEWRAEFAQGSARDIGLIEDIYQRARYSDKALALEDAYRAEGAWRRLRGKLFRLAFVRPPRAASPSAE